jgi:hypothetical protein
MFPAMDVQLDVIRRGFEPVDVAGLHHEEVKSLFHRETAVVDATFDRGRRTIAGFDSIDEPLL